MVDCRGGSSSTTCLSEGPSRGWNEILRWNASWRSNIAIARAARAGPGGASNTIGASSVRLSGAKPELAATGGGANFGGGAAWLAIAKIVLIIAAKTLPIAAGAARNGRIVRDPLRIVRDFSR